MAFVLPIFHLSTETSPFKVMAQALPRQVPPKKEGTSLFTKPLCCSSHIQGPNATQFSSTIEVAIKQTGPEVPFHTWPTATVLKISGKCSFRHASSCCTCSVPSSSPSPLPPHKNHQELPSQPLSMAAWDFLTVYIESSKQSRHCPGFLFQH